MQLNYVHQERIFDPTYARPVVVIGAGSVGSYVVDMLGKVGVSDVMVFDEDTVASHNISMSAYGPKDIGRLKVRALADIVHKNSGLLLQAQECNYTGESLGKSGTQTTVVACVHDMPTREMIWKKVEYNPQIDLFCDTRTAGSYIEVYAINPNDRKDVERYTNLLFPESERVLQMCGHHGIAYGSLIAASAVVANITTYWSTGTKRWRYPMQCDTLTQAA